MKYTAVLGTTAALSLLMAPTPPLSLFVAPAYTDKQCTKEINAASDLAITLLAAKVLATTAPVAEALVTNPTKANADAWVVTAANTAADVTKRPSGNVVFAYAYGQSENVLKLALDNKQKIERIMLLDEAERQMALTLHIFGAVLSPSILQQPAEIIVKASLSSCNAGGQR